MYSFIIYVSNLKIPETKEKKSEKKKKQKIAEFSEWSIWSPLLFVPFLMYSFSDGWILSSGCLYNICVPSYT